MPIAADDSTLVRVLAEHAGGHDGTGAVTVLGRRPMAYESSSALEELDVRLAGGDVLALVVKDCGAGALSPQARAVKPRFVHDPEREALTYRHLLAPACLGTPRFYGAAGDGRSWLFVERVGGTPLREVGELERWQHVAGWLGTMHRRLSAAARELRERCHLLVQGPDLWRTWMRRSLEFARSDGDRDRRRRMTWLARRHERVVERLSGATPGFLHGDFNAANVLLDGQRVCAVDWEMAALGPPALDLAALVSGGWSEAERTGLCSAYHRTAASEPLEELTDSVTWCRLQLAIQWLGWAAQWKPPPEQRHDWLEEAISLAQRLEA